MICFEVLKTDSLFLGELGRKEKTEKVRKEALD